MSGDQQLATECVGLPLALSVCFHCMVSQRPCVADLAVQEQVAEFMGESQSVSTLPGFDSTPHIFSDMNGRLRGNRHRMNVTMLSQHVRRRQYFEHETV
jgi:hypothetical protein